MSARPFGSSTGLTVPCVNSQRSISSALAVFVVRLSRASATLDRSSGIASPPMSRCLVGEGTSLIQTGPPPSLCRIDRQAPPRALLESLANPRHWDGIFVTFPRRMRCASLAVDKRTILTAVRINPSRDDSLFRRSLTFYRFLYRIACRASCRARAMSLVEISPSVSSSLYREAPSLNRFLALTTVPRALQDLGRIE